MPEYPARAGSGDGACHCRTVQGCSLAIDLPLCLLANLNVRECVCEGGSE